MLLLLFVITWLLKFVMLLFTFTMTFFTEEELDFFVMLLWPYLSLKVDMPPREVDEGLDS